MSKRSGPPIALILLLLFTVLPLVELALLIYLAFVISPMLTILLVIVTGVLGAMIARQQGWHVWNEARREMDMGRFPADSIIDALLILVAGALLVTPGVLTDIFGFSTLIPSCRAFYRKALKRWFKGRFHMVAAHRHGAGGFHVYTSTPGAQQNQPPGETTEEIAGDAPAGSPFEDTSPFGKRKKD